MRADGYLPETVDEGDSNLEEELVQPGPIQPKLWGPGQPGAPLLAPPPQGPPVPGPLVRLQQQRKLRATFHGNPDMLPYFLFQVETYLLANEGEFEGEMDHIHKVRALLEGDMVAWYMGLF
uniref:Uncharacterized protein n=1 Tax=Sphaerodactylus townsendi TaxID=933632 RepID=A0ACB8EWK2_9SAUR